MSEHAAGSWTCFIAGAYSVTVDGDYRIYCKSEDSFYRIAYVDAEEAGSAEERKAIARLIASAPDLLKALEGILVWDDGNLPGDMLEAARAAIAKAKGIRNE